jgi:hypothetical protein
MRKNLAAPPLLRARRAGIFPKLLAGAGERPRRAALVDEALHMERPPSSLLIHGADRGCAWGKVVA